jgi:hypothetical protein
MAITFEGVIQQILNALGAVKGATATDADTNFSAVPTVATVIGPDFVPRMVEPALARALGRIAEAIASTPLNPERGRFESDTDPLANNDIIPRDDSSGNIIIGVPGRVRDAISNKPVLWTDADKVRSFNEFSGTVYAGFSPYWCAKVGDSIIHTRANVIIRVCTYTRPTTFTGNIPSDDWHEDGLVQLSVAELALKESMFQALFEGANTAGEAHLAQVRSYANPALYSNAQAAPSST